MNTRIYSVLSLLLLAVAAWAPLGPALSVLVAAACCECKVTTTVNAEVKATTKTLGEKSIREAGRDGVETAIKDGVTGQGGDVTIPGVQDTIDKALDEIFADDLAAYTYTLIDATYAEETTPTEKKVTVNVIVYVVILLPSKAKDKLAEHENGHKLIAEKVKDLAKAKFKEEIDKATCEGAEAAYDKVLAFISAVHDAAEKKYDDDTNHGRKGGPKQQGQQAAASFDAALAEALKNP